MQNPHPQTLDTAASASRASRAPATPASRAATHAVSRTSRAATPARDERISTQIIRHPRCDLIVRASDRALLGIDFMPFRHFRAQPNALTAAASEQLVRYLDGQSADFRPFALDFRRELSPFAAAVYAALADIPYGERWPYKELGFVLRSRAYQAIGGALSRNPFLIALPCHRIVRSDAALGGFSSARGADGKRILCELEAAHRAAAPEFYAARNFIKEQ